MVAANLKPAKRAGVLSEGILLCAKDAEGKPVMPMQENHAAREQDKPAVSRPAVKGSVVSKRASAKGKAGKAQRKNASSPKNRGDSNTSRTDSTKDGGGGR